MLRPLKTEVVHLRVEPAFRAALQARACQMGVKVSELVRQHLAPALGLDDDEDEDAREAA